MEFTPLFEKVQPLFGWLAAVSLITFIVSLLLIPFIVSKLPSDIFINYPKQARTKIHKSIKSYLIFVLANLLAITLIISGFIMLFIPGQGLLTILIGLLLLSFPGKQKAVLSLIRRKQLQKSLNWIRAKQKKGPFLWPE